MYNVKQTSYEDGSSEIMVSDYAFGVDEKKNKKKQNNLDFMSNNSGKDIIIDTLSPEEKKEHQERSKKESVRRSRQSVEIIGRANTWEYFITLTFNPEIVDSLKYEIATIYIERWLDKMRKRYPTMKSLFVFEKHKSGRWHAHGLLADCKLNLVESGHKTKKTHDTIYNISDEDYEYGFTTVTHVRSSAAAGRYISKYIGKALGEVPKNAKRYWASKNCKSEKDCTVKRYICDKMKEDIMKLLSEISFRKTKSYIPEIDNTVTYFHLKSFLDIDDLIEQISFES